MRSIAGVFICLACGAALAADDAALQRCRAIRDSTARLACYDALPIAGPESRAAPAPASPAAAPAPAAVARTRVENFGLEQKVFAQQEAELTTIQSSIPGHFEGWKANERIRLANGQVWQIADGSSRFMSFTNPKVVVRRGLMGGFFLEIEDDSRSPRVRRVQ